MNGNTWRIVFAAMLTAATAVGAPREDIYWSEARGKGGDLAYRERHTVTFEGERILHSLTEYLSPEGKLIATMESDYSLSVAMPTYLFEDLVRGSREGLRREGDDYLIFRQEPGKEEETKVLRETDSVFSCQGWHYFLVENLDLLAQGNLKLDLILPSELKAYTFQVEQVGASGDLVRAVLKIDNRILRLFAPKLRLVYDARTKKLLEYQGISNIPDANGKRQDVSIMYTYAEHGQLSPENTPVGP